MRKIKEVIVVEGRYDKNTLKQLVDATIIETSGFGIFNNAEKLAFLRTLADKRGLIILTDGDGAGFVIRNYLKGSLPKDKIKQAYIPDIYGKEKRKTHGGKEGKLGVEGMTPEILLTALENAGATFEDESSSVHNSPPITKADFLRLGLSGAGSAAKREALQKKLSLPKNMTANALLEFLNLTMTLDELESITIENTSDDR